MKKHVRVGDYAGIQTITNGVQGRKKGKKDKKKEGMDGGANKKD